MFGMGMPELLVVMILALLVFGPDRLSGIGSGLGKALRGFREGAEDSTAPPRLAQGSDSACSRCGAARAEGTAFCARCGRPQRAS